MHHLALVAPSGIAADLRSGGRRGLSHVCALARMPPPVQPHPNERATYQILVTEQQQREGLDEAVAALPPELNAETVFIAGPPGPELAAQTENVDLMIGLYCEPLPKGIGFSDTAFRVFILMASRRLKSDRFFTRDYTAKTYTQEGLDWIGDASMITVLLRHFPRLAPALAGVRNGFAPWKQVAA